MWLTSRKLVPILTLLCWCFITLLVWVHVWISPNTFSQPSLLHFISNMIITYACLSYLFAISIYNYAMTNTALRSLDVQQSVLTSFYLGGQIFWCPIISLEQFASGIFSFAFCQRADHAGSRKWEMQDSVQPGLLVATQLFRVICWNPTYTFPPLPVCQCGFFLRVTIPLWCFFVHINNCKIRPNCAWCNTKFFRYSNFKTLIKKTLLSAIIYRLFRFLF